MEKLGVPKEDKVLYFLFIKLNQAYYYFSFCKEHIHSIVRIKKLLTTIYLPCNHVTNY